MNVVHASNLIRLIGSSVIVSLAFVPPNGVVWISVDRIVAGGQIPNRHSDHNREALDR